MYLSSSKLVSPVRNPSESYETIKNKMEFINNCKINTRQQDSVVFLGELS